MWCPQCNFEETKVTDTRIVFDHRSVRRRRRCLRCGYKFSTMETYARSAATVVKRDGREEEFDSDKIVLSLKKALKHDGDLNRKIEQIIDSVIKELDIDHVRQLQSVYIGQVVMNCLRSTDPVAYLRYASIYKDFTATHEFEAECRTLSSGADTNHNQ